jgi:hypothetical protein
MSDALSKRRRWLAHPRTLWVCVALGVLCMLVSVDTGLSADDYLLKYTFVGGTELPWAPLGGSGLPGPGDAAQVAAARDIGLLPWTASTDFSFAFLRPLSLLTHRLDFALWPDQPWLMHLHNVAWFSLFLAAASAFIRRVEGPTWVAGLAMVILALDDAHGPTIGWIANRNLVMAGAFGFGALLAHDRAVRDGRSRWLAPLLFVLALASNEGALGLLPLWLGYTLWCDHRPRRWSDFAVVVGLGLVWLGVWMGLGFGVHHSGVYADIGADPLGSILQVLTNFPVLAMSLSVGVWAELFSFAPADARPIWLVLSWTVFLVTLVIGLRLARTDRRTAMWLLGALGALLPVTASFPSDRLLLIASVPGAVLLAKFVQHLRDDRRAWRLAAVVVTLVLVRHVGLNLLLSPLRSRSMEAPQDMVDRSTNSLDLGQAAGRIVVLINPPSDAMAAYGVVLQAVRNGPLPRAIQGLYSGLDAVQVVRVDTYTLRILPDSPWMDKPSERLSRDHATQPFSVGDTVRVPGLTYVIDAISQDGRPAALHVVFDAPLEDPRYRFHAWDVIDFRPFDVPAVGDSTQLPATDGAAAYFGVAPV